MVKLVDRMSERDAYFDSIIENLRKELELPIRMFGQGGLLFVNSIEVCSSWVRILVLESESLLSLRIRRSFSILFGPQKAE